MSFRWHILTGEYPPQCGGVADYTRAVASRLAACGDQVCVWCPPSEGDAPDDERVIVRRLGGNFTPPALSELDAALRRLPGRVLLQYTPHAFGSKAMNVPLCLWLWARRRQLDVMFHEVAFPFVPGQPWKHKLLATTHRGMAALLVRAAERVFVSVPGWESLLTPLATPKSSPIWTPVPTNLPTDVTASEVWKVRAELAPSGMRIVGHFGTYGPTIIDLIEPALRDVLTARDDAYALLLGRGSEAFAGEFARRHPEFAHRLIGRGSLETRLAALHIASCDVMLQPYPDGVSSRRGSTMAGLALGRAIVTNEGQWSEPLWRESGAVESASPAQFADCILALLREPGRRKDLERRAALLYRSRFDIENTIAALRSLETLAPPEVVRRYKRESVVRRARSVVIAGQAD